MRRPPASRTGALRAALAVVLVACSGAPDATAPATPPATPDAPSSAPGVGFRACSPDVFAPPGDERLACEPLLPEGPCGDAAHATLGRGCVPVGVLACAAGFVRDADGPGCRPVLPAAACAGATRASLGDAACVPIGDCTAPPPGGANVFVDAAFTNAQLDATHVRTLAAGVAAAPRGGLVVVAPGTYVERLVLDRALTIAGRCAERVVVRGPGDVEAGIRVVGGVRVALSGLTLTGHGAGALTVEGGADVTARDLWWATTAGAASPRAARRPA